MKPERQARWRVVRDRRRSLILPAFCTALCLSGVAPAFGYAVQLGWSPVSDAVEYRVYVSQASGAYQQGSQEGVGARTPDADGVIRCVVDQGLIVGAVNDFAVTSYSLSDVESAPSNQLSLQLGAPGAPATSTRTKLLVKDKDGKASRRKVVLISKNDSGLGAATPGSGADPMLNGGQLIRVNPTTTESDTFLLPPAHWKGIGHPPGAMGFKYTDSHQVDGPCKKVLLKPGKLLRALCKGDQIVFSLDEPQQGSLAVKFTAGAGAGALSSCMELGGPAVIHDTAAANGKTAVFIAKGVAPAVCPIP